MSGNLIIIGNGFDIDHNIESRYKYYEKYLRANKNGFNEFIEQIYLEPNKEKGIELWSDFETALANPDLACCKNIISTNYYFGSLLKIGEKICESFSDWIKTISIEVPIKYLLNKNDKYFTFNYTGFLEAGYKIPEENINYIHGHQTKALFGSNMYGKHDGIIVGHKKCECNDERKELIDSTEKDVYKIIREKGSIFKSLSNLDINTIKVFGCSYCEVDYPYFELFRDMFKNAFWELGYQTQKDKDNMGTYINKLKLVKNVNYIDMKNKDLFPLID